MLGRSVAASRREFAEEHGEIPNDRVALVALGAAGRREFETGAPLDLLFVYDHDAVPSTLGLTAEDWHEQFVQRLLRLFGEVSPEGMLYDTVAPYGMDEVRHAWSIGTLANDWTTRGPPISGC